MALSDSDSTPARSALLKSYKIRSALALHGWDQETGMPPGGGEGRAAVMGELAAVYHQCLTDSAVLTSLREEIPSATGPWRLALERFQEDCLRKVKIPESLDREMAHTTSRAQQAWAKARSADAPEEYLPWLEKVLALKRQEALCLAQPGQEPYEALLQGFEPGMSVAVIEKLFAQLQQGLGQLMQSLPVRASAEALGPWPVDLQERYLRELLGRMGFDWQRGRLDRSAHPFSEGVHGNDVRITVRYREDEIGDALFSALHEGGHGLYEQGFDPAWTFTPLAEAASLGLHESQSRFWENCVGRSHAFWQEEFSHLRSAFPNVLANVSVDSWMARINRVRPSFIRVDADEVTYNLHVLLRFRIERQLVAGSLPLSDLRSAWDDLSQELLGIRPPTAREGFLQDVHWSFGAFGYFPTYTLGNLYAAELWQLLGSQKPQWQSEVASGQLGGVLDWLRARVHNRGRQLYPADLMRELLGREPGTDAFFSYLESKRSTLSRQ